MLGEIMKGKKKKKKNTNTISRNCLPSERQRSACVKAARIKVILLKYFLMWDLAITKNGNKENGVLRCSVSA